MAARFKLLEGQWLHALGLAALVGGAAWALVALEAPRAGEWLGLSAGGWILFGVAAAVAHQVWVWLWWRLELHHRLTTRLLGAAAFRIYAAGFALLAAARIGTTVGAAVANRGTVAIPAPVAWTVAALLLVPVVWLLHSLARHFGLARALGTDHFFPGQRSRGLCRAGIFRHVPHAMYTVGFLALWAPAVACASWAALLLAAFNHAYIWVHYFATERPDMARIYGPPS